MKKKVFIGYNAEVTNKLLSYLTNCSKDGNVIYCDIDSYLEVLDYGSYLIDKLDLAWGFKVVDLQDEVKPVGFMSMERLYLKELQGKKEWENIRIEVLVPTDILDYINGLSTYLNTDVCFIYHTEDNSMEVLVKSWLDNFSFYQNLTKEYNESISTLEKVTIEESKVYTLENDLFSDVIYYLDNGLLARDKEMQREKTLS